MKRVVLASALIAAIGASSCTGRRYPTTQPTTIFTGPVARSADTLEPVRARSSIDAAIREGVAFLIKSQNPDGSWGTGVQTRGTEIYSMVPGSHDAFRVGTSALCVMALREAMIGSDAIRHDPAVRAASHRGQQYLVEHGDAKRDAGPLLYNTWAHIYTLQALAAEMRVEKGRADQIHDAADRQVERLVEYETYLGGWNYYDFKAQTRQPSLAPTSFQTAAALVAMYEAREVGIEIPQGLIDRAIRRVEECRLPDGSYLYGSDYLYQVKAPANQMNGSIGRQQSNNFALWLWNSPRVGRTASVEGLKNFFDFHPWLAMGRKRPFPHEAWYQTSGYYYYFAHYYAARIIEKLELPPKERAEARAALAAQVMPFQEADGSWWDYAMWDYHKPYGTAYAVMILLRCQEPDSDSKSGNMMTRHSQ